MPSTPELAAITGDEGFRRIEVRQTVSATPARVWQAITCSDEVEQWWDRIEVDAREGGRVVCVSDVESYREGGIPPLDGTVKAFLPPHIFEFTWNEATEPAQGFVRLDLVEITDTTSVTLVYLAAKEDVQVVAAGWHYLLERLAEYLKTGAAVQANKERERQLYSLYEAALGQST